MRMTSLVDVIYISHEFSQPLRKSIEFSRNGESQYKVKVQSAKCKVKKEREQKAVRIQ